jgi:hypothetical protein
MKLFRRKALRRDIPSGGLKARRRTRVASIRQPNLQTPSLFHLNKRLENGKGSPIQNTVEQLNKKRLPIDPQLYRISRNLSPIESLRLNCRRLILDIFYGREPFRQSFHLAQTNLGGKKVEILASEWTLHVER